MHLPAKYIRRKSLINTLGIGVLVIGAATYLSVVGAIVFRRIAKKTNTNYEQVHSMADPMLNVVATLFSILLGFLVAGAMDKFASTQEQCETEALKLADIYSLARGMQEKPRIELQKACREYCDMVIHDEWPMLAEHKNSPKIWSISLKLWDVALAYEPDGDRQVNIHEALIDSVRDLGDARRSRIVAARQQLSPALWIVVIGGSIILIACTYMFYIENPRLQFLMIALVSLSLSLNVLLLAVYSNPFVGDLKIKPEAFEMDQVIFKEPLPPLKLETGAGTKEALH